MQMAILIRPNDGTFNNGGGEGRIILRLPLAKDALPAKSGLMRKDEGRDI